MVKSIAVLQFQNTIRLGILVFISFFYASAGKAGDLTSIPAVRHIENLPSVSREYRDLQYLARRYDCTTNLENGDPNRPVNRYEFAVAISSCWQELENSSDITDIAIWRRLKQNFAEELSQVRNKVEGVETNLSDLESQQFSTTSKLEGQVLFFIADGFGGENDSEVFTGYRVRLDFNTSFWGQDLLNVRLESRDIGRLDDVTDTSLSRLSVDGSSENSVEIAELSYTFTPIDSTTIVLGTTGVGLNDVGEVLNPFSSSSKGAISRFGRRNPATLRGSGGAGVGIQQEFGEKVRVNAGYLIDSDRVGDPEKGGGLFDSSASAIAQGIFQPNDELALAFTYTRTYQRGDDINLMGATGLEESNEPFGDNATTSDNLGLQANWEVSSGLEIGGWFGYTAAQQQEDGSDRATILNGAFTFAFPDLFVENSEGGIIIGVPPTISNHDDRSSVAESTPLHLEALYRIEISDRLEITPGAFAVFNPDIDDGDTIWVGAIRTLFSY
ncbi:MAG: iron uptake porin [Cyanobacteria bacterium P01_G01_bin.19]